MSAICVHSTTGRLRLRSAALKNDALLAASVETHLAQCIGVSRVAANSVTGSVLVSFDPRRVTAESVIREVRELELAPITSHVGAGLPVRTSRRTEQGNAAAFARVAIRLAAEKIAERLVVVLILAIAA